MKTFNKLYYILTFTWGVLANVLGAVFAVFFVPILKADLEVCYGRWVFIGGDNWGGLSLGNFIFMSRTAARGTHTLKHELGHSLQNSLWGPLFLFVIGIPSAVRCGYRETSLYKNKSKKTDYDSIWFEGQATAWGTKYVEVYKKSEEV